MPRRPTPGETQALAVFAQQLEGIKHRFASAERHNDRFELYGVEVAQPAEVSLSIDDWGAMLDAVKVRLRLTVDDANMLDPGSTPLALRASVLECVDALDQLHAMLGQALSARAGPDDVPDGAAPNGPLRSSIRAAGVGD
jgi:hypothetical protein